MSRKKYVMGPTISDLNSLAVMLENHEMVFVGARVYAPGWVISMQLRYVIQKIKARQIRMALPV